MKQNNVLPTDYYAWLDNFKATIRSKQIKAALLVNVELIQLYWDLGKRIDEKIQFAQWGEGIIKQIAADLKTEFPHLTGFSRSNLFYMRQFYVFYSHADEEIQQLVGQIPWGHNILIFRKIKSVSTAIFYLNATIENNWSRSILDIQLDTKLHERQGQASVSFYVGPKTALK